jgi:hypothetical protein
MWKVFEYLLKRLIYSKTAHIHLQDDVMQNQVILKSHGPGAVGTTIKKSNFACVYMRNI